MKLIFIDGVFDNNKSLQIKFAEKNIIPFFVNDNLNNIKAAINYETVDAIVTGPYLKEMDAITFNQQLCAMNKEKMPLHIVYNESYNGTLFNYLVGNGIDFCIYGNDFIGNVAEFCEFSLKNHNRIKLFPVGEVHGDCHVTKSLLNKYCFNTKLDGSLYFEACLQIYLSNDKIKSLKNDVYPVIGRNFKKAEDTIKKEVEYAVKDAYKTYHSKKGNHLNGDFPFDTPSRAIALFISELKK